MKNYITIIVLGIGMLFGINFIVDTPNEVPVGGVAVDSLDEFGAVDGDLSLGKVKCDNDLDKTNSEWETGITCEVTVFYKSKDGGDILDEPINFQSDGGGKFVIYDSGTLEDTISSTTDSVVLKSKQTDVVSNGKNFTGQTVKYIQEGTNIPKFSVTTKDGKSLSNK